MDVRDTEPEKKRKIADLLKNHLTDFLVARALVSTVVVSTHVKMSVQQNIVVVTNVNCMDTTRNFVSENFREQNNMISGTISLENKQIQLLSATSQVIVIVVLIIY